MNTLGSLLLLGTVLTSGAAALGWVLVARRAAAGAAPGRAGRGAAGLVVATLGLTAGAVGLVQWGLLRADGGLAYAERVLSPEMPVYYRFTALWSALEGSLLLWLLTLALTAVLALRVLRDAAPRSAAVVSAVLSAFVAAFALVAVVASPFTEAAGAGARPSPLLQDHIAMGVHPPLLYAGFALLAVPFALSVAGLVTGRVDRVWSAAVHRWTRVAWVLLTLGIVLGAWWSYAVLGWGGYWAWDPVENASLLPWLAATALLHIVSPRTGSASPRWAVAVAGLGFLLVLLATFLTRSGVVESIHAFTVSGLGPLLLGLLVLATAAWGLLLVRRPPATTARAAYPVLSRRGLLDLNRVLLLLIAAVVLVGTLLPSVVQLVTGDRLAVGPPWYHRTLAPLALLLLAAMAIAPFLPAGSGRGDAWRRVRLPAVVGVAATGVAGFLVPGPWLALLFGLAAFVVAGLVARLTTRRRLDRRQAGALLAHLGLLVGAVAVLAGGQGQERQAGLTPGETLTVGGTTVTLVGVEVVDEGRRSTARAELVLGEQGAYLGTAHPELRWYEQDNTMLAGPDIRVEPFRDVYVTMLDVDPGGEVATVRLAVTPLVGWLWVAGAMVALGGTVAGAGRRGQRGEPASRAALVEPGAQQPAAAQTTGGAADPVTSGAEAAR